MKKLTTHSIKPICHYLLMPIVLLLITVSSVKANNSPEETSDSVAIQGRWDITIDMGGKMFPSWLEIRHSGLRMLVGQFVGIGGSARPISRVNFCLLYTSDAAD